MGVARVGHRHDLATKPLLPPQVINPALLALSQQYSFMGLFSQPETPFSTYMLVESSLLSDNSMPRTRLFSKWSISSASHTWPKFGEEFSCNLDVGTITTTFQILVSRMWLMAALLDIVEVTYPLS